MEITLDFENFRIAAGQIVYYTFKVDQVLGVKALKCDSASRNVYICCANWTYFCFRCFIKSTHVYEKVQDQTEAKPSNKEEVASNKKINNEPKNGFIVELLRQIQEVVEKDAFDQNLKDYDIQVYKRLFQNDLSINSYGHQKRKRQCE